jgi:hypothetical protein
MYYFKIIISCNVINFLTCFFLKKEISFFLNFFLLLHFPHYYVKKDVKVYWVGF